MRVYIAGPISGLPEITFAEKEARFHRAAKTLKAMGHEYVIPMEVEPDCPGGCNPDQHVGQGGVATHSWECFMRHDLMALLRCNAIALLPGWQLSRGAALEARIASELNLPVMWFDEDGTTRNEEMNIHQKEDEDD